MKEQLKNNIQVLQGSVATYLRRGGISYSSFFHWSSQNARIKTSEWVHVWQSYHKKKTPRVFFLAHGVNNRSNLIITGTKRLRPVERDVRPSHWCARGWSTAINYDCWVLKQTIRLYDRHLDYFKNTNSYI